jgi:thioredoxin 1
MSDPSSTYPFFAEGCDALKQLQQTSENPILVKFVAPHCPSCNTLAPVLQQLVTESAGKLHLVTIDMTAEPEFTMEVGVYTAPTVILFKGTTLVEKFAGLKPKKSYSEAIQKALS